jgi:hypothetical protein
MKYSEPEMFSSSLLCSTSSQTLFPPPLPSFFASVGPPTPPSSSLYLAAPYPSRSLPCPSLSRHPIWVYIFVVAMGRCYKALYILDIARSNNDYFFSVFCCFLFCFSSYFSCFYSLFSLFYLLSKFLICVLFYFNLVFYFPHNFLIKIYFHGLYGNFRYES